MVKLSQFRVQKTQQSAKNHLLQSFIKGPNP